MVPRSRLKDVYIGERRGSTCPSPAVGSDWELDKLFDTDPLSPDDDELDRFCLYRWIPAAGTPDPMTLPSESGRSPTAWLHPDEPVVVALAPDPDPSVIMLQEQRAWFRDLVGAVSDLGGLSYEDVRIAAIGDSPTGYATSSTPGLGGLPIRGRGRHEESLGRMLRSITCPADLDPTLPCVGHLSHHLALSLYWDDTGDLIEDTVDGGEFGYRRDLARAIHSAVETWRDDLAAGGPDAQQHLIVSLAVGFSRAHGGDLHAADVPGPALAVVRSLEHAVRRGALVIAGIGNAEDGPSPTTGPMYPGGWEGELVTLPDGTTTQLLHAVGGVDQVDAPLFNSLVGVEPRLVAPGLLAIDGTLDVNGNPEVDQAGRRLPTRVLTGCSVSTYVTAAAAALLRGRRPSATNDEIMEALYLASEDLGRPATAGGIAGSVRRIDICSLLQFLGGSVSCIRRAAGVGPVLELDSEVIEELREHGVACDPCAEVSAEEAFDPPQLGACGALVAPELGSGPVGDCPDPSLTLANALGEPYTFPFPGAVPCVDCPVVVPTSIGVNDTADLVIEIDSLFATQVDQPVLTLTCASGLQQQYPLGSLVGAPLKPGDRRLVKDLPLPSGCQVVAAEIAWQVPGFFAPSSVTNALAVVTQSP
ncbi:MAG: S8 family serine peptidase [Acidobacteriota bacterium]